MPHAQIYISGETKPDAAICTSLIRKFSQSPQKIVRLSARRICNCEVFNLLPLSSSWGELTFFSYFLNLF
ncbi:hypothetical protein H6G41_02975 [Tolypothrix sp. FACHB-123]|nr:hypothetical protein [Tolypothrix sp. FACHB-123]